MYLAVVDQADSSHDLIGAALNRVICLGMMYCRVAESIMNNMGKPMDFLVTKNFIESKSLYMFRVL